jgi:hypothetical protein
MRRDQGLWVPGSGLAPHNASRCGAPLRPAPERRRRGYRDWERCGPGPSPQRVRPGPQARHPIPQEAFYPWSMIFSDLPTPAEASRRSIVPRQGFAQAGNRCPLFGIRFRSYRRQAIFECASVVRKSVPENSEAVSGDCCDRCDQRGCDNKLRRDEAKATNFTVPITHELVPTGAQSLRLAWLSGRRIIQC